MSRLYNIIDGMNKVASTAMLRYARDAIKSGKMDARKTVHLPQMMRKNVSETMSRNLLKQKNDATELLRMKSSGATDEQIKRFAVNNHLYPSNGANGVDELIAHAQNIQKDPRVGQIYQRELADGRVKGFLRRGRDSAENVAVYKSGRREGESLIDFKKRMSDSGQQIPGAQKRVPEQRVKAEPLGVTIPAEKPKAISISGAVKANPKTDAKQVITEAKANAPDPDAIDRKFRTLDSVKTTKQPPTQSTKRQELVRPGETLADAKERVSIETARAKQSETRDRVYKAVDNVKPISTKRQELVRPNEKIWEAKERIAAEKMKQSASQPVSQPVVQPASQPVSQPVVQPVSQPVVQPVSQPVSQPAQNTVSQPAQNLVVKPSAESTAANQNSQYLWPTLLGGTALAGGAYYLGKDQRRSQ